jgi:hypothetical protein
MAAREVRPTDLVAATCRRCSGPFLWRRPVESGIPRTAPLYCRACQAENQADFYARRVRELREQAVTLRASQKRAFARWRPPLSQAEAQKHNGERV